MRRLMEKTVFSGLVTACRFANWPTRRSPLLVIATTEGVSRDPSLFSNTVGSPPSMTAITEFVVPRSIPSTFAITSRSFLSERPLKSRTAFLLRDQVHIVLIASLAVLEDFHFYAHDALGTTLRMREHLPSASAPRSWETGYLRH